MKLPFPELPPRTVAELADYLGSFTNWETQRALPAVRKALGPARARALLERADLLPPRMPIVQVAGSKGKGSTVYWMEALLLARGARPGAYLSPHLTRVNERIRVAGSDIDDAALLAGLARLHPLLVDLARASPELLPTFFDLWTVLALQLFTSSRCSHALVEVGLGGPLDSTSAIPHDVGILTTVDLEHRAELGDTLEEIAFEKAGIARAGSPFIIADEGEPWCEAARARARALGARPLPVAPGARFPTLPPAQRRNLAVAIAALESLPSCAPFSPAEIDRARELAVLPARLERLAGPPEIIIDSAHTPRSILEFARAFAATRGERPASILIAFLADKEWQLALEGALPWLEEVEWIVTRAPSARSLPVHELAEWLAARGCSTRIIEDPDAALELLQARGAAGSFIATSGSFYLAGLARTRWLGLSS